MSEPALEVECLDQLRDYIKALGGELIGDWKCRAQVRDYGSRAGSVDTWFTSPDGEVYRSKVAAARGCGLDPSRGTNTKRSKAPRKPSTRGAAAAAVNGDGNDQEGKDATGTDAAAPADGGSADGDAAKEKNGTKEGKPAEKSSAAADGENGKEAAKDAGPASKKKGAAAAAAGAGGAGTTANDAWKWATSNSNAPRPVDLSMQEIGELLISMPESFDVDDCYEGPLYYKEAQLRHAAKLARAAAQAASAAAAERAAAELAAAQAVSLAESEAKQARRKENAERAAQEVAALIAAVNDKKANSRPGSAAAEKNEDTEEEEKKEEEKEEDVDMPDAPPAVEIDDGEERKKKQVNYNEQEEEEEHEEEDDEEEEEEPDLDGGRKKGKGSRRNTRHSLAAAVAAAAAILQDQSGTQLPPSVAAAAADAAGFFGTGYNEDGTATGEELLSSEPGPPPGLDLWDVELEVIRKCFVRVPVRLGRPIEDEPVPLSPTSRDAELTTALLTLSDNNGNANENNGNASGRGGARSGNKEKEKDGAAAEDDLLERDGAASMHPWYTKRFAVDQITANDGEPSAVHPAGLFYLRHVEEEVLAEERALRRDAEEKAARREAKRLEKQNALGPDGQPRPALPKPANLSLRGKSIEEVEEALMERLSTYVTDLGGILPDGWRVKASIRQNGANAGGVDAYYYDPTGRRHKSMIRVAEVLGLEATAAAKPKTLASILGTSGGKRGRSAVAATTAAAGENGTGEDAGNAAGIENADDTAVNEEQGEQKQQQQQQNGGDGDGDAVVAVAISPKVDGANALDDAHRESSPPIDGSEEPGSARKTCGVCRTCLNPQLKKGCLANRAAKKGDKVRGSGGGGRGKAAERRSPSMSPTPPPPKKLTARQIAKIERLKREQEEKEAARAKAAAEEEEEEEAFRAADAAAAAAAGGGAADGGEEEEENEDVPANEDGAQININEEDNTAAAAGEQGDVEMHDNVENEEEEEDAPAAGGTSNKGKRSSGGGSAKTTTQKTEAGGSKRSRTETTTTPAAGGGDGGGSGDDDDDEDDRGKRPKLDEDAKDGVAYPRRDRKQVKQQDTPGNDEESKKKKEAAKAARREKRKNDTGIVRNAYDRAYNRLKGQLSRLRQEQALVEAYAADGWRGASREKVKPVAEIKRAKEQIQRCKEVIRECVKVVDEAEGDKSIPAELFDEDGELDLDYIFCAKCHGNESTDDNDIILCDGHCNRAYHVKCLVPPVDPEALPEDEGWLCPSCDRKIDMIDDINDEFGTDYEYETPWEEVLAPGTLPISPQNAGGINGDPTSPRGVPVDLDRLEGLLAGADLPSDDEEDEDYAISGSSDSEGAAGGGSGEEGEEDSDGGSGDNDGSDDSDDDGSLVSEDLGGEILDVEMTDAERTAFAQRYAMVESDDSDDSAGKLIVQGKRRRTAVDYKALNQEMFGDAETPVAGGLISEGEEEDEEDEGWSPRVQARKAKEERARKKKEEEEEEEDSEEEGDEDKEEEDAGDAAQDEEEEEKEEEEENDGNE